MLVDYLLIYCGIARELGNRIDGTLKKDLNRLGVLAFNFQTFFSELS